MNRYDTEKTYRQISMDDYMEKYVNVGEFLEYCKQCPNYGKIWSCPPYDFDPEDVWRGFSSIYIAARKITFPKGQSPAGREELAKILSEVKDDMSRELFELEKEFPGSVSLSAGSCGMCRGGGCTRPEGEPCRFPEKMRFSIESLGGNVGLTVSRLMGIELEWMEEGKMPSYFVLVGGLMKK